MSDAPGPTDAELLEQLSSVERRRRLESVAGALSTVAVGQLLFAAFAFGSSRGPVPLLGAEVLIGILGTLVLSVLVAQVFRKRRLLRRATAVLRLREGPRLRRVALFEGYLTVDEEVVLPAAVQSATVEQDRLLLRYRDARHGGPVLRELEGPAAALGQVADAVRGG
jgi:hypothetical protein